jgi:hypothetical protein
MLLMSLSSFRQISEYYLELGFGRFLQILINSSFIKLSYYIFPTWGDVIYKDGVLNWKLVLLDFYTVYNSWLQFTLYSAFPNSHSLQFTTHALSPLGLLSLNQSSGNGFQRRTFSLPGFQNYPRATPTATPDSQSLSTFWDCLHCLELSQ